MGEVPDFLTVEEAARVLRIGRTAAYQLARRFRHTRGAEGLPVVEIGRQLRVPRARLEAWAGGSLHAPAEPLFAPVTPVTPITARPVRATRPKRTTSKATSSQSTLPFTS